MTDEQPDQWAHPDSEDIPGLLRRLGAAPEPAQGTPPVLGLQPFRWLASPQIHWHIPPHYNSTEVIYLLDDGPLAEVYVPLPPQRRVPGSEN